MMSAMRAGTDDERLLEERVAGFTLPDPRMTARMPPSEAIAATVQEERAADTEPAAIADLPRITLDARTGGPPVASSRGRPDYALVATLGEGGMGRVHLARQRSLARDVAVKTLKPGATPAVAQALLREARVTGMLEHPGVIPVHALGVDDDGRPMLVMKRIDGVDLATRLAGAMQTGEALVAAIEILMQVCRTLELAHSRGVIHRDIKPENVMVGGFGEVYLLDWGIATKPGEEEAGPIVGTPVYMAPEMVLGHTVDARTDVYLLGATLHEVLSGRPRHEGGSIAEILRSAALSRPFAYGPEVPDELAALCNRCTAREPGARPASVAAVREELAAFLRNRTARALADAALARLASLESLLAQSSGPPADLAAAYRLVTEARFGLTQAMREGSDGTARRAEMRRCLVAAIELELRQDHVDTAAAMLHEIDPPDADLARRIGERRAAALVREREHARLERLDRELDPTEHADKRTVTIVALATTIVGAGSYIALRGPTITPESTVAAGSFGMVILVVAGLAVRRRLLTNAFNRRAAALLVLGMGAALTNRIFGLLSRTPPEVTLRVDLYVFTVLVAGAAITFLRGLWLCTVVLFAGVLLMGAWPAKSPVVFTFTTFLALVVGAAVLARARRSD